MNISICIIFFFLSVSPQGESNHKKTEQGREPLGTGWRDIVGREELLIMCLEVITELSLYQNYQEADSVPWHLNCDKQAPVVCLQEQVQAVTRSTMNKSQKNYAFEE